MINISMIYCSLSELTSEKLVVGLLAYSDKEIKFFHSENKLKALEKLVPESKYFVLNREIQNYIAYYKESNFKSNLYGFKELENSIYHASLHQNNTIRIQAPIKIDIEFNDANLKMIEQKYLHNDLVQKVKKQDTFRKNYSEFKKSVSDKVSIQYKLTKDHFKFLKVPIPVPFAGKNGNFVFGNTLINGNYNEEMFYHKLNSIVDLSRDLSENLDSPKHYIITDVHEYPDKQKMLEDISSDFSLTIVKNIRADLSKLALELHNSNCIPLEKVFSN